MGKYTGISWAHHTRNAWIGCAKVSPACKNCYAERDDARLFGGNHWGASAGRKLMNMVRFKRDLRKWDREARTAGEIRRVFINSMSDTFEEHASLVAIREELLDFLLSTTDLVHLLLTKRPDNISKMVPREWLSNWPEHVWVGITAENQEEFDWRWRILSGIPGIPVRFTSSEPLLGPLDLSTSSINPDWVIVGGESAAEPKCRPIHASWVTELENYCRNSDVPFFFKQWGNSRVDLEGNTVYVPDKYSTNETYPAYRRELPKSWK